MRDPNDITYFAKTDFRNQEKRFGIKQSDRTRHVYVIGKTGMGKSTLLSNMAVQDVQTGRGMAFLDPHGNLVEDLLDFIPEDRVDDVLYFAPFDLTHPISFNVMEDVGYDRRHLVANGLMAAFKKIWVDMWSARMEYILNNTLLALLEYPDSTLLGVNRMLADKVYRKRVVTNVSDVAVRSFWEDEFANYSDRYMTEAGAAIQNKIGQFISNPLIRNIVGQARSSFDIRELMDNRKILLINLSKGKVGEDNANLLGSMLITKIYLAAMSRSDVPSRELKSLPQFYFYVDEFQSFANESFADILSEARKYNLSLTIAHQYIEQMTDEVRAAVFGNVGTMITFRVGATDAEVLEREFAPVFLAEDIVNLGFAQIYLRLMIDGVGSKPFSARTLPPLPEPSQSFANLVIRRSRENYALGRSEVEEQLAVWHESHGGLIDDPNVKRRRDKENAKKQAHIDAYEASRETLADNNDIQVPRPGSGNKKSSLKTIKPESGSDPGLNQRLQKAIAKTQHFQAAEEVESKKKKNNDKKAKSKESLNELRSTLADVLQDAGLKVPDKSSSGKKSGAKKAKQTKNSSKKTAESAQSKQSVSNKTKSSKKSTSSKTDSVTTKSGKSSKSKSSQSTKKATKRTKQDRSQQKPTQINKNLKSSKRSPKKSPTKAIAKQSDTKPKQPTSLSKTKSGQSKQIQPRQENDTPKPRSATSKDDAAAQNQPFEIPEAELRSLLDI